MTTQARLRTRRLITRATGPSAITVWTWAITAPFALTVMSGLQYVEGGPGAVLTLSITQHLTVGLLLAAGWALLRVTPSRWKVVTVFGVFAGIGVLRPLLFLGIGELLGIGVATGDLGGRIAINVVTTVTAFTLIAVGVDLVRDHLGVYRRLRAAQRASELDAENAALRVRGLRHAAVDGVLIEIERTAAVADAPLRPSEAARMLRGLATDVVRPLSHRLYEREDAPPPASEEAPRVRRRDWVVSVLGGMRPAPPVLSAVLFAALVTPFGLSQYGLLRCTPAIVAGLAVVAAGNLVVSRLAGRSTPQSRMTVLIAGYALVGVVLSLTTDVAIRWQGLHPHFIWFEAGTYPVIALGVALVVSLSSRVRLDEKQLEAAVQASVFDAARLRADYDHQRAAFARMLHSGVQSELIAAALALGTRGVDDASAELRRVVDRIRAELLAPAAAPDPESRIRSLVESWRSAVALQASVAPDAWERLREPVRCEAVVDAISEGLANAVRHGDGGPVTLDVHAAPDAGVVVVVTSGGALSISPPGIGLRQLAENADVDLSESEGRVRLAVVVP
jgi:signal transduction histidine kinase